MEGKILPYIPAYFDSFVELLARAFEMKSKNKAALINWKFFAPSFKNKTISYVALTDEKQVIAQYTNIPFPISFKGTTYKSLLCLDMATHPNHRGQGYISKLSTAVYREVLAKGYDFSIGFSNESGIKVDTFSKGYGYKIVGEFRTYRKVILLSKKSPYTLKKTNAFKSIPVTDSVLKVEKTDPYFKWRYMDRPNGKYSIFEVIEGSRACGSVVLHLTVRSCVILDIIASHVDVKQYHQIIEAVENYCLSKGIRLLSLTVLDNKFWKKVFTQNYFLPGVYSSNTYYLTVKIHKALAIKTKLLSCESWLLMGGDIL